MEILSKSPSAKGDESSPFQKAQSLKKQLKLFMWGPSGVGKTTLGLQFPQPVIIDLEGGVDLYGDSYDFDILRASSAEEVKDAVDWLNTHQHSYKTLIIDPMTVYWDALQWKCSNIFLRRNKGSKEYRFEFYNLQARDWMTKWRGMHSPRGPCSVRGGKFGRPLGPARRIK